MLSELEMVAARLGSDALKRGLSELHAAIDAELGQQHSAQLQVLTELSREMRTHLTPVLGLAGLLRVSAHTSDRQNWSQSIEHTVSHLVTLLNGVLSAYQGAQENEQLAFDLMLLANDLLALFAAEAEREAKSLRLTFQTSAPRWANGDPGQLRQLLTNLLDYAICNFPGEGIALTIDGLDAGDMTRVRFTLSPLDPIGTPRQVEQPGRAHVNLAISHQLLSQIGGVLKHERAPSERLTLSLPLVRAPLLLPQEGADDVELTGRSALVVGPPTPHRARLATQLAELHVHAQVSTEQSWPNDPFDLLFFFVDQRTDAELLARVSKRVGRTPWVLVSTSPTRGEGALARQAGAHAYLASPLTTALLARAARALLTSPRDRELLTRHRLSELGHRPRVLLVDADAKALSVLCRMLESLGCKPTVINDAGAALAACDGVNFDLMLCAEQLARHSGANLVRTLRARRCRVGAYIGLAGDGLGRERQQLIAAGVDAVLDKPISFGQLAAALAQHADHHPIAVPPTAPEQRPVIDRIFLYQLKRSAGPAAEALLPELIESYLAELPGRIAQLRRALEQADIESVSQIALRIAASSTAVGASAIREQAIAIQQMMGPTTAARSIDIGAKNKALVQLKQLEEALPGTADALRTAAYQSSI